jgi:Flp pilus assembly protein TadD
VFFLVALAAVVASGVVVIGVLATRSKVPEPKLPNISPALSLDLGLRTDPEARALRHAEDLYVQPDKRPQAAVIFKRYHSLEAEVGAAMAAWPNGTVTRLQKLASEHAKSGLVELQLGVALSLSGRNAEANTAWRRAARVQPDSLYAVRAGDMLHPHLGPDLPTFVPSSRVPHDIRALSPPRQFAALEQAARTGGARQKILYGVALQRLYRPISAERQFAAAAREAPSDPEARVAAAFGLFSKDNPSLAFSRLGPLVRVFPHAQTVRLHLGLLLIWIADVPKAREELRKARAEGQGTPLGRTASAYLRILGQVGTR